MAKGKFAKKSDKGGLVLMLIVTMLVIGACVVGIFMVLNRKGPQPQPGYQTTDSTPAEQTEGQTDPTTAAPTTQPTEATTVPTEATTAPTEETTVPTEATTVPTVSGDSGQENGIAQTALAQVGKPYKSGGNGPDDFDTSGFVYYCLKQNGQISKRLKLKQLVQEGTEVAREDLQPGDVVFFWTSNEGEVEYAGIYVGDGKFVAARNEQNPVSELSLDNNYFSKRYLTARRFEN